MRLRAIIASLALCVAPLHAETYRVVMAPWVVLASPMLGDPTLAYGSIPFLATNLVAGGGVPGGSSGQVQYNSGGTAFGGVSGITLTAGTLTSIDVGDSGQTISKNAAGEINIEGVQALTASNTVTVTNKTLRAPNGSLAAPPYSFASDPTRGMLAHPSEGNCLQFGIGGGSVGVLCVSGAHGFGSSLSAQTSTYTTTVDDYDKIFTNAGDTDGATITLLNNPSVTGCWRFAVVAAQTLTIQPSAGETLYDGASTCASLAASATGATITICTTVTGSGGSFMTFGKNGTWTCS